MKKVKPRTEKDMEKIKCPCCKMEYYRFEILEMFDNYRDRFKRVRICLNKLMCDKNENK